MPLLCESHDLYHPLSLSLFASIPFVDCPKFVFLNVTQHLGLYRVEHLKANQIPHSFPWKRFLFEGAIPNKHNKACELEHDYHQRNGHATEARKHADCTWAMSQQTLSLTPEKVVDPSSFLCTLETPDSLIVLPYHKIPALWPTIANTAGSMCTGNWDTELATVLMRLPMKRPRVAPIYLKVLDLWLSDASWYFNFLCNGSCSNTTLLLAFLQITQPSPCRCLV